jgi:hypothetical protein
MIVCYVFDNRQGLVPLWYPHNTGYYSKFAWAEIKMSQTLAEKKTKDILVSDIGMSFNSCSPGPVLYTCLELDLNFVSIISTKI